MFLIEVYIKMTPDKGYGVFTTKAIKKGTVIWDFIEGLDIKVHRNLVDNLNEVQQKFINTYFWRQGGYYYSSCDLSIFQNHSLDPNSKPSGEHQMIASRDILPDEELTTDYSDFDEDYPVYKNELCK